MRALVITTALALSLSACGGAPKPSSANDLPAFQQQRLTSSAAPQAQVQPMKPPAENQVASLEPMVPRAMTQAPKPVPQAQPSLVVLRRTEPVVKPLTEEQLTNKLKDITAAGVAEAKQVAANTAAHMERLTLTELTRMRLETAQQLALLEKQSQIYAKEAELNASKIAYTQADQKAAEVEARTKEVTELREFKSDRRFEDLRLSAEQKIAQRLAEIRADEERKTLKPEDVKQIASATVKESAPQLRAMALEAVTDSEDYIRTVARTAVKDKDPEMQTALKEAARDVIVKDNQIVFAIRRVVDQRLEKNAAQAKAAKETRNPDGSRRIYNGDDISLESKKLGVGQLSEGDPFNPEANIEPAAGADQRADQSGNPAAMASSQFASNQHPSLMRARQRQDWVDLRKYRVVLHEDRKTIEELVNGVVINAEPFVGPWEIKWKIKTENRDILTERFSLDVETTFEEFVNYLANYMVNERGVKLSFSLFDSERVIVVSD